MNRAWRVFGWAVALGIAVVGTVQAEELFPRPAELEPAVKFWTRVYTEVDTQSENNPVKTWARW